MNLHTDIQIIQTYRFRLHNRIHKSNLHYITELETLSIICTIHVQNHSVKQYYLYTIHVQNHIVKHTIHFDFLLIKESEPRWFFFAGFLFFDSKGGGGDSWPMVNLATWCLLVSGMTSSFMNSNNCSCTVRILCGVRYCLLKLICCNFKNQRSELSSMCVGIKI
jgi:hypothetical protein